MKKYYIPIKLNRVITVGAYHIRDFFIILALIIFSMQFIFITQAPIIFTITVSILQIRVDNRPISIHIFKIISCLIKDKNYCLKDLYKNKEEK